MKSPTTETYRGEPGPAWVFPRKKATHPWSTPQAIPLLSQLWKESLYGLLVNVATGVVHFGVLVHNLRILFFQEQLGTHQVPFGLGRGMGTWQELLSNLAVGWLCGILGCLKLIHLQFNAKKYAKKQRTLQMTCRWGGGRFSFTLIFGEMIQFDQYVSNGLKPPYMTCSFIGGGMWNMCRDTFPNPYYSCHPTCLLYSDIWAPM